MVEEIKLSHIMIVFIKQKVVSSSNIVSTFHNGENPCVYILFLPDYDKLAKKIRHLDIVDIVHNMLSSKCECHPIGKNNCMREWSLIYFHESIFLSNGRNCVGIPAVRAAFFVCRWMCNRQEQIWLSYRK